MILKLIRSIFQSPRGGCISLYHEAKRRKSGKAEREYLKLILLTKPPFDYQLDSVIEETLREFKSIEDLSDFITDIPKDDCLWESRTRNLKIYREKLEKRNQLFFKEFWS
jgi:hypothetical protein